MAISSQTLSEVSNVNEEKWLLASGQLHAGEAGTSFCVREALHA
jgi:hypothetical protein